MKNLMMSYPAKNVLDYMEVLKNEYRKIWISQYGFT